MLAQGPQRAQPLRRGAIKSSGTPSPDLKYFEVQPPVPCPSVGQLEIFAVCFLSPMPSISECGHML